MNSIKFGNSDDIDKYHNHKLEKLLENSVCYAIFTITTSLLIMSSLVTNKNIFMK